MGESLSGGGWFPVVLSSDLPPGGVMRAVVDGADMVVWRGHSGRVHAWDNRCPHRGMRLSFGFVRGDRLACLYHGWQYGEDAACRHIPAHPDLEPPQTICATAYGCIEFDGLIWASAEAGPATEQITELQPYEGVAIRSIIIDAAEQRLADLLAQGDFPLSENEAAGFPNSCNTTREAHRIVVEARDGNRRRTLVAALHALDTGKTMVHLQTTPDASAGLKVVLSRWAERLRWIAENQDAVELYQRN